jgi:hypothetical protein
MVSFASQTCVKSDRYVVHYMSSLVITKSQSPDYYSVTTNSLLSMHRIVCSVTSCTALLCVCVRARARACVGEGGGAEVHNLTGFQKHCVRLCVNMLQTALILNNQWTDKKWPAVWYK